MKKIALIGTHGTGKSTLVYRLAGKLKEMEIDADPLREVARLCPLPINEYTTKESQEWIIYNQYVKEIEEQANNIDVLVCDRSVLDGYVYYYHQFGENELLEQFVKEKITTYDQIWKVPTIFSKLKDDGVRSTDKDFQTSIDEDFDFLLNKLNIEYYEFTGVEETALSIKEGSKKSKFDFLKNEMLPYQNTLVIDEWDRVMKLVGIYDGGEDYYWVYEDKWGKAYYATCVGRFIPLKGFISEKNYEYLANTWNLNSFGFVQ